MLTGQAPLCGVGGRQAADAGSHPQAGRQAGREAGRGPRGTWSYSTMAHRPHTPTLSLRASRQADTRVITTGVQEPRHQPLSHS